MKELVGIFRGLGYFNIHTYIQSGNVIFRSKTKCSNKTVAEIGSIIMENHGFEPKVLLLEASELETAQANNPFQVIEGKALHFYFLDSKPENPDIQRLIKVKSVSEEFKLDGSVFYLHAPDGIGRSKLAAAVKQCLGVAVTAGNWNTVNKLISMVEA